MGRRNRGAITQKEGKGFFNDIKVTEEKSVTILKALIEYSDMFIYIYQMEKENFYFLFWKRFALALLSVFSEP